MKHIRKTGYCVKCGKFGMIRGRGMCAGCYTALLKNIPDVDCFAVNAGCHHGQCGVMVGRCRLMAEDASERACPFHKTKAAYTESALRARERIYSLPVPQKRYIIEKYLSGGHQE